MTNTIDFSQARFKHYNWRFKIKNFLDGKETLPAEQAISHFDCDLGKWFYSSGKDKYGHLPCMIEFEGIHVKMHDIVIAIQKIKTADKNANVDDLYKDLIKVSDRIIELLNEAERLINNSIK
jgi:methyl-accepting chemotaxis protein